MDVEDPSWDPTISFGGHHRVTDSYGLPQALPGTKMAVYSYTAAGHRAGESTGGDWRHDPWTQLRWMVNYAVGRYGSECGAWEFRRAHGYY